MVDNVVKTLEIGNSRVRLSKKIYPGFYLPISVSIFCWKLLIMNVEKLMIYITKYTNDFRLGTRLKGGGNVFPS